MAGESNEETMATIMTAGFDCIVKAFQLSDGSIVNCYIYDTAGQERFNSVIMSYYRKGDAISPEIVMQNLTMMELKGIIKSSGSNYFITLD